MPKTRQNIFERPGINGFQEAVVERVVHVEECADDLMREILFGQRDIA